MPTAVSMNEDKAEWFATKEEMRQGCVMYQWLFNMYMDVCEDNCCG